jgi:hypothetical protein
MDETPEEIRLKIARYRELIRRPGKNNAATERLKVLVDEMESQLTLERERAQGIARLASDDPSRAFAWPHSTTRFFRSSSWAAGAVGLIEHPPRSFARRMLAEIGTG